MYVKNEVQVDTQRAPKQFRYPGEELTDDYGYLNCLEPFECLPEPHSSRTHVLPDDLLHFYKEWDNIVISALHDFSKVHQPLAFLIEAVYRKKVALVASGNEPMDSILNCITTAYNFEVAVSDR